MTLRLLVAGVCLAGALGACTSPIDPAGAITVTTGIPFTPANGALFANSAQPVSLSVRNGFVADPGAAVTYAFEVASDSAFLAVVQRKDVAQRPDRTSVALDVLPSNRQYYWRVRTVGADTHGEFTSPMTFTVGP